MSAPVLEAARAERERLEERCAWHLGQLDRLEQQLEALKEIERLAERLGHGTAGEAPPATAPGGGVSPARSVPKERPAARQRPAQRAAAGPVPKVRRKAPDGEGPAAVLRAVQAGARTQAEIIDRTGLTQNQARHAVRVLVAAGDLAAEGATKARRYRLASPAPAPVVLTEAERAGQSQAAKQDKRDARQAVLAALRDGPLTTDELRERAGLGRHEQTQACGALTRAGKIVGQGEQRNGSETRWVLWEHARHGTPRAARPGHEEPGLVGDGGEDYAPAPNFGGEPKAGASGRVIA